VPVAEKIASICFGMARLLTRAELDVTTAIERIRIVAR